MSERATIVVILGMHRSGTSLLAELLHDCGLSTADELLPNNEAVNARGFWEDKRVVEINEHLFEILGSSWYDIRDLPTNWLNEKPVQELLQDASGHIAKQYGSHDLSIIKDPRLSRLLPFWKEAISLAGLELACIVMLRSPHAVAQSLLTRNKLPESYSSFLWGVYTQDAIHHSAGLNRSIVDYDDLLSAPEELISRTLLSLNLEKQLGENISNIADGSLRHHLAEDKRVYDTPFQEALQNTYLKLRTGQTDCDWPADKFSDAENPTAFYELAKAAIDSYSNLIRVGDLHSLAQKTVEQRDISIEDSTQRLEKLAHLFSDAETTVKLRDSQLHESNEKLDEISTLLEYATKVVEERDQQLQTRNGEYSLLESAHNSLSTRLQNSLIGRLALRWTKSKDQND